MKAKPPTSAQNRRWDKIRCLGCLVCGAQATIHHLYTGAGGRKNHDRVAPLCWIHHIGPEGIDGRKLSKRQWQEKYLTEHEMEARVSAMLAEDDVNELIG